MIVEYFFVTNESFKQSLNFSNKFTYKFSGNTIYQEYNDSYIKGFFGENITNINALIGENGAGKTTTLKTIIGILNNKLNQFYKYLVIFREENKFYYVSNIKGKINSIFPAERKSVNFISNKLNIIFYSNVFDGNNIFKSNKMTQNISTNALIEKQFSYKPFSLNEYQKEQNDNNILFTILNRNELELDNYINIPKEIFLEINEITITTNLEKVIENFENLDIKIFLSEDIELEKRENIYNLVSYNFYLRIIKWMDDLLYILTTNAENNLGRIIWEENEFEKVWANLNINQEAITEKELLDLKKHIKSILLDNIEEFYGDKYPLTTKIKKDILSLKRKFNLTGYSWDFIIDEINSLIIDQLITESNLTDEEFDNIKTSMLNLDMKTKKIKQGYKKWVNKRIEKHGFENFLNELELKFIELIKKNSKTRIYDGYLSLDDDDLVYHNSEEFYFDLIEDEFEEINNNFNMDIKISYNVFETDYLNELIDIFQNRITYIKDHLFSLKKLLESSDLKIKQFDKKVTVNSTSKNVYEYFRKYRDEKVFEVNWRNLSSGEYSFLGFLSKFYKVNREVYRHKHLFIIIDEGELYFHPQWQKKFIYILINALNHIFSDRKLQIILTSHSPFIVSDLPHYSIELIAKSKIKKPNEALGVGKTFAANIQDLYANAFFLQGGLTGEFSKYKINKAINDIVLKPSDAYINQDNYFKLFNLIGEPIVKKKSLELLKRYVAPFESNLKKEDEIRILRERIRMLENEL